MANMLEKTGWKGTKKISKIGFDKFFMQ